MYLLIAAIQCGKRRLTYLSLVNITNATIAVQADIYSCNPQKRGYSILYYVFLFLFLGLPGVRMEELEKLYGPRLKITENDAWRSFHARFDAEWNRSGILVSTVIY